MFSQISTDARKIDMAFHSEPGEFGSRSNSGPQQQEGLESVPAARITRSAMMISLREISRTPVAHPSVPQENAARRA
jgi:hypothetical protein